MLSADFRSNFEIELADSPELIQEAMALRYQVYCVERGYENPAANPDGRERDQFDTRAVHAVVRHRASSQCIAAVRLVLADTDDPGSSFPVETIGGGRFRSIVEECIGGHSRRHVAEISRFAVSKEFRRRRGESEHIHGLSEHASYSDGDTTGLPSGGRRHSPQITVALFTAVVRLSRKHDVTHWFAVMEPGLLRLLEVFGIHFRPLGPAVDHHGLRRPCFAVGADVAERTHDERPDVWALVTNDGSDLPPR